ncbi:AAA family ATPase [Rhodanobacter sp. DHB23]|uniref:AAA family ATPase n=1 Tax=Rhodanobacter sp. DHB23 TaxID=2775923 RepID=UPI0017871AD1|nr:AAA family ATPase [Rhodanobacter sp. DHB23]MBD8872861.1 AAA family ATPase [Rhodanobacter sp. DHB23]
MLKSVRLSGFRSIEESGWIDLAPITVVLGKNSSGKSSFLRLFPLLKQSLNEETKEPILWYGRLVDFGSFSETLSKFREVGELSIGFRAEIATNRRREVVYSSSGEQLRLYLPGARRLFIQENVIVDASLTFRKREGGESAYVSAIMVAVFDSEVRLEIDPSGNITRAVSCGVEVVLDRPYRIENLRRGFFPAIKSIAQDDSVDIEAMMNSDGPFFSLLLKNTDYLHHGNTSAKRRRDLARRLRLASEESFINHVSKIYPSLSKYVAGEGDSGSMPAKCSEIFRYALLKFMPDLLAQFNVELDRFAGSVRYLAPVRATASRYYRFQELAVDEIDPLGDNVPMFINSLSYNERVALETWMTNSLGFKVQARRSEGHTALIVREEGSESDRNLADTGFGYSQVLPIVLQIWKSLQIKEKIQPNETNRSSIIAIEQPELHLHPRFQALLADVFADAIRHSDERGNVSFIIETHSEHIVNRLGALVAKGLLREDQVTVVLFDKESPTKPTIVRRSYFNKEGVLEGDWPFGFFLPEA